MLGQLGFTQAGISKKPAQMAGFFIALPSSRLDI